MSFLSIPERSKVVKCDKDTYLVGQGFFFLGKVWNLT